MMLAHEFIIGKGKSLKATCSCGTCKWEFHASENTAEKQSQARQIFNFCHGVTSSINPVEEHHGKLLKKLL